MTEVRFVDITLRDGQQSLWAYGMRTGAGGRADGRRRLRGHRAGGPVELPKCIKELRENPWNATG